MSEDCLDEQVAAVVLGLMRVRRALDPESFDTLLGALQTEIQIGMDVAEEEAMEAAYRSRATGNVVPFRPRTGLPRGTD